MLKFNFESEKTFSVKSHDFIPLGKKEFDRNQLESKLVKEFTPTNDIWGTLGCANDTLLKLRGHLKFSERGNDRSVGSTGSIVDDLKSFNPLIDKKNRLIERFIDFNQTVFEFPNIVKLEQIPELRLTLFLEKDEGALVYYQHSLSKDYNDSDADIEFIQPQATDAKNSTDRDRLHYYFDILPKKKLGIKNYEKRELEVTNEDVETGFIIKILTFKRAHKHPDLLIKDVSSKINSHEAKNKRLANDFVSLIGNEKYALLKFDSKTDIVSPVTKKTLGGCFNKIDENAVDTTLKTLLLIHGTFSSTYKTFNHLLEKNSNEQSFLQTIFGEGKYEQILAFDHPTITKDAFDNVNMLLDYYLPETYFGNNRVDVIACSRGGIVAECLSGTKGAIGKLELNKIMLFSPANGVAYFTFGDYVSKFLSVYRKTISGPYAKIVLALAQLSVDYFLKQPGCVQMTQKKKNHEDGLLEKVLKLEHNYDKSLYKTVVSDWEATRGSIFNRGRGYVLDQAIALILGKEHDWVVGCTCQRKLPVSSDSAPQLNINSMHTKYLDNNYVGFDIHAKIEEFLLGD